MEMEFLRKLFVQTTEHLKGLTVSQRLAIGSCAGLIVLSLLWLVNWAKAPVRVPLLNQPLTAEEMVPIQNRLDAMGVSYEVSGDVLMVPMDTRARLLATLDQGKILPNDISMGFKHLIEDSNPFRSGEEQAWAKNVALGNELAAVLREFDGVESARVFIDNRVDRRIGRASQVPTASVFVKLQQGSSLDKPRVHALASFVSRTVTGMDISNVNVTDAGSGRSYSVPRPDAAMAFDDLDDRRTKEEYFAEKVRQVLAGIPGVLVAVHTELTEESKRITEEKHGKPVLLTEKTENMTQNRSSPAAGPGVVPNTSRAVASGGPPSDVMEKTSGEATYDGKADMTLTTSEAPRHGLKSISAAVNVPRSYLAAIFRSANEGKEPADADLDPISTREQTKIRELVRNALGLSVAEQDDKVVVRWFHDEAPSFAASSVLEAGPSEGMAGLVRTYGGKAGLGALAVLSLGMMLMMVRRVSEGPVLPGEEPPAPRIFRLGGGRGQGAGGMGDDIEAMTAVVGNAEVGGGLMMGKEVDERTLRTQQVIEELAGMVKDNPEASVSILERWMESDQT